MSKKHRNNFASGEFLLLVINLMSAGVRHQTAYRWGKKFLVQGMNPNEAFVKILEIELGRSAAA